ncbi:receptor-like protein kinase HERK 1 [Rutidosis leptorrhynchoides]|uniref:receptor-like protein kinase HERK 1 n=1 Tax=Rutidosis leptorrhynchoides TaxID=125765 RepID=UPI003A9A25B3
MLSSLRHQNLVHFVGFCYENNEMILVNKYEANGSLDRYIGDPITLTWMQRLQICVGIARAISYIHYDEARDFSIVHRNVRSSKILLDDSWQPKLAGFELSMRSTKAGRDLYVFAHPCGMKGYVDPKYIESSSVTHKSDVYSFGVVLFEVLCGRRAFMETEGSGIMLSDLVKSHFENGTLDDMIDQSLRKQMDQESYKVFSETAYCCLKDQRAQRPHIDQILIALEKALQLQLKLEQSTVVAEAEVEGTVSERWKR